MRTLPETVTNLPPRIESQKVVLDSFAWIEYFSGSLRGEKVREYVQRGIATTPTIVLAEISEKYARMRLDPGGRVVFVRSRSVVIALDEELALLAGRISYERKKTVKGWGLADSIMLATARRLKARVVTGDSHFKDLTTETIMI